MSGSWKVTLPCTRAQAEAIDAAELDGAVLVTTEEDEAAGRWRLDAYFEAEPDAATLTTVAALVGGATGRAERLGDEDWVTLSQAGLEPIREGRFAVHTSAYAVEVPPGGRAFLIEASRAFGTGHHATTAGCVAMLDRLAERDFETVIDIGTGTGLLAFVAHHLWPSALVVATDIDPAAMEVTHANAVANRINEVDLIVADGALHDAITARAPYDLIIANVLAGPLISMAPELAAIAAPGATIVLAGLLETQREQVVAAYVACGCSPVEADRRGDWTILRLATGARRFEPTAPIDPNGRDGWALDL